MFLTFQPLKPYVLIYFVLIKKKRVECQQLWKLKASMSQKATMCDIFPDICRLKIKIYQISFLFFLFVAFLALFRCPQICRPTTCLLPTTPCSPGPATEITNSFFLHRTGHLFSCGQRHNTNLASLFWLVHFKSHLGITSPFTQLFRSVSGRFQTAR